MPRWRHTRSALPKPASTPVGLKTVKRVEMTNKTRVLHVRVTENENEAFKYFAEGLGETRARILRKMIRESINGVPDLLHDERFFTHGSHSTVGRYCQ